MQTIIRTQIIFAAVVAAFPFSAQLARAQSCVPGLGMTTSDLIFGVRSHPAPPQADFTSVTGHGALTSPTAILATSANHAYVVDSGHVLSLTYSPTANSLTLAAAYLTSPNAAAIATDGANLWIAGDDVEGISLSGGLPPRGGPLANGPAGKMIYDGKYLWISHPNGIHPGTLTRVQPAPPPASPVITQVTVYNGSTFMAGITGLTFDGQYVWALYSDASHGSALYKLDPSTGVVAASYTASDLINAKDLTYDGYSIWVADANKVARFDAATGARTGTYAASDARSLRFDGIQMWVADRGSNSIVPIRACDGASVLKSFTTPAYPENVAFDGANLWATSPTSHTISIR
jgi:hypothetical protein